MQTYIIITLIAHTFIFIGCIKSMMDRTDLSNSLVIITVYSLMMSIWAIVLLSNT